MHLTHHHRRGITLLEVLISMGILTVGLVSVLAMIPAGRSQAVKATTIDRTSALALNAAADFMTRGFARPAGWLSGTSANFAVFDPLAGTSATTFWTGTIGAATISPRVDAVTSAASGSGIAAAGGAVSDIIARGEDDLRYTTDTGGPDDPPVPQWSAASNTGRRVFDGTVSYLATLSGTTPWTAGAYKTLTIVTFSRRDASLSPVTLTPDTSTGTWVVNTSNVPAGMTLKDLVKPGGMVLFKSASATQWYRVLLAADATRTDTPDTWVLSLTCEGGDPDATNAGNRLYVFPGANGSLQTPIKLEGTSPWND